MIQINV